MTLPSTLPLSAFSDLLKVADTNFVLAFYQQMSGSGGGETLYADRAPARWKANPTTIPLLHPEAEGIMALLNSRVGGLKTFLLTNAKMPYPSSDPDGSLFGVATPLVGTITDAYHLAFTGFPANYVIPLGTYFQIIFGSTQYYLGQFCEAKTASAGGAVSAVEVAPALPASVATSNHVTVIKPAGKFRAVPNSAYPSTTDALHSTITFAAEQSYAP